MTPSNSRNESRDNQFAQLAVAIANLSVEMQKLADTFTVLAHTFAAIERQHHDPTIGEFGPPRVEGDL